MYGKNSGYSGWSMSNRAVSAYEVGEKPKSKWTKKDMLDAIAEFCDDNDMFFDEAVTKLKKDAIFDQFFEWSSWHHTSKFCNDTDFYELNEKAVNEYFRPLTEAELEERAEARRIKWQEAAELSEKIEQDRVCKEERINAFQVRYGCHPFSFAAYIRFFPDDVEYFTSKKGNKCVRIHTDKWKLIDGATCRVDSINCMPLGKYDSNFQQFFLDYVERLEPQAQKTEAE
jgi:hypothetical protein